MADYEKLLRAAGGVTFLSAGIGWGYHKFFPTGIGAANITFSALAPIDINVRQQIASGVDPTLAGKLISYLSGIIPLSGQLQYWVTLYIAAFIVVALGAWASTYFTVGKTPVTKFGFGMAAASFGIGLVLGSISPSIGALGTAGALAGFYVVIAAAYVWISNNFDAAKSSVFPAP